MTHAPLARPPVKPVPVDIEGLISQYKLKRPKNMNDEVESLFLKLWSNPDFRKFVDPVWVEDSVEGDLFIDDVKAVEMIRDLAVETQNALVKDAKLKTVLRAYNVVKRRYGVSREVRKEEGENGAS